MLNRRQALALLLGTAASNALPRAAAAAGTVGLSDALTNGSIAFFKALNDQHVKKDPSANVVTAPIVDLLAWLQPTIGVRDSGSLAAINRFFKTDSTPAAITNAIVKQFEAMAIAAKGDGDVLKADSQMWIGDSYNNPDFTKAYVEAFDNGTPPVSVNFLKNSSAVTAAINQWASDTTDGKISRILDKDLVPMTQYAAASTLYFKAPWGTKFDAKLTQQADFTLANGTTLPVQMMSTGRAGHDGRYLAGDGFEAVAKPFGNLGQFQFVAVKPSINTPEAMSAFISRLPQIETDLLNNKQQRVCMQMPRMKLSVAEDMLDTLRQALPELFSNTADFSGVARGIQQMGTALHKIEAQINEDGGEVAAAAAVAATRSIHVMPAFKLDRPSFVAIVDTGTGGAVMRAAIRNPAQFNIA